MGFQQEDSWWQLTLPSDTVTFNKNVEQPTMIVNLNNVWLDNADRMASAESGTYWDRNWSDCDWQFQNFWLVCERVLESETLVIDPAVRSDGLAAVVSKYFDNALIKLTNPQHQELFPTN